HQCATRILQVQRVGQARVDVLGVDPEGSPADLAGGDQLVQHVAGQVGRDRESQPDVAGHAAARVEAGGVDADQFAAQVDQCAAGVARVDRSVGLDEILVTQPPQATAPDRRHDPGGDGL